jgi:hypothetical protein
VSSTGPALPFVIQKEAVLVARLRLNSKRFIDYAAKFSALEQYPAVLAFQFVGPKVLVAAFFQERKECKGIFIEIISPIFCGLQILDRGFTGHLLLFQSPRRYPELPRRHDGINGSLHPPGDFIAVVMVVPVVGSAQRHRELVAYLYSHAPPLGEPKMVCIRWGFSAYQTGLRSNKLQMRFVAEPTRLANPELTFLDLAGPPIGLLVCRHGRGFIDGWFGGSRQ